MKSYLSQKSEQYNASALKVDQATAERDFKEIIKGKCKYLLVE